MKVLVVAVVLVGCKYPDPGFDNPGDDAPPGDGDPDDGMPDDDVELPACPAFTSADNKVELPGIEVAGFSVTEDESFAISWLSANTIGYTEPPLGAAYMMTNLANNVVGAHVIPDGSALYLFDYNATFDRVKRSMNAGSPAMWGTPTPSGLPDNNFPGRPTRDDQRVAFADENGIAAYEWERIAGTWTQMTSYSLDDFGLDATSLIGSANLTIDGAFLLYTVLGEVDVSGIYYRVRGSGGTFKARHGASGGRLADGTYLQPMLTMRCSHLFAFNTTTRHVDRFDVHP